MNKFIKTLLLAAVLALPFAPARAQTAPGPFPLLTSNGAGIDNENQIIQYLNTLAFYTAGASGGATTITAASANAFTVGPNGTTNPSFNIDTSTANAVSGLNYKAGVTGATSVLSVTDPGTNSGLSIFTKGASPLNLGSAGNGNINFYVNNASRLTINATQSTFIPLAATTGPHFLYTSPFDTLSTNAEYNDVYFNTGETKSWVAGTSVALQREARFAAPTYSAAGASTITEAATLSVDGPPAAGTSMTLTQTEAIRVGSGTIALENGGTAPTVSSCGGGAITAGSGTHKGVITGITAATACTVTFATGQPLPSPQTCTYSNSAGIAVGIASISATTFTTTMAALTGTLYYECF